MSNATPSSPPDPGGSALAAAAKMIASEVAEIEAAIERLTARRGRLLKAIEELERLDNAPAGPPAAAPQRPPAPAEPKRRPRWSVTAGERAAVEKRLRGRPGEALSAAELRSATGLSSYRVQAALRPLVTDGRVERLPISAAERETHGGSRARWLYRWAGERVTPSAPAAASKPPRAEKADPAFRRHPDVQPQFPMPNVTQFWTGVRAVAHITNEDNKIIHKITVEDKDRSVAMRELARRCSAWFAEHSEPQEEQEEAAAG